LKAAAAVPVLVPVAVAVAVAGIFNHEDHEAQGNRTFFSPRALPWAVMFHPFGVRTHMLA
jgi:hypothetical protein